VNVCWVIDIKTNFPQVAALYGVPAGRTVSVDAVIMRGWLA
jgi:hypothetical protein